MLSGSGITPASAASGPRDAKRHANGGSARQRQASLGRRLAEVASKRPVAQWKGDTPRVQWTYARRSMVPERACPTRHRRRAASTTPDVPTRHRYVPKRHRSVGWSQTLCIGCRRFPTSASPASTARGARSWRPVVAQVADKFLACGVLEHGFARIRCNDCAHEYLLAFSCKCRDCCPRCHARRLARWTPWRDTTLLAPVLHRQVVLTIPKRLRAYCLYRRRRLGEIARVAARTVTAAIRTLTGERERAVGIGACLQTHGSRANWHPHLHLLVTDGGFRPDGTFVAWPAHDTARLTEACRRAVRRRFVRLARFDAEQTAGMLTWPHSGFHVHPAVWVPEDARAFATRLARDCARNPVPWSDSRTTGPPRP